MDQSSSTNTWPAQLLIKLFPFVERLVPHRTFDPAWLDTRQMFRLDTLELVTTPTWSIITPSNNEQCLVFGAPRRGTNRSLTPTFRHYWAACTLGHITSWANTVFGAFFVQKEVVIDRAIDIFAFPCWHSACEFVAAISWGVGAFFDANTFQAGFARGHGLCAFLDVTLTGALFRAAFTGWDFWND